MKTVSIYKLIAYSLDFEGYFRVKQREVGSRSALYTADVIIGNTEKELLEEFKNEVGFGRIDRGTIPNIKSSKVYRWSMNRAEILEYLPKIIPFLIIKWRQGELVLEATKIIKPISYVYTLKRHQKKEMYTDDEIITLNSIYWECAKLNERYKYKHSITEIESIKLGLGRR